MLDSINHRTIYLFIILLQNHIFGVKTSRFCHLICNVIIDIIT